MPDQLATQKRGVVLPSGTCITCSPMRPRLYTMHVQLPAGNRREDIPARLEAYQRLRTEWGESVNTESVAQLSKGFNLVKGGKNYHTVGIYSHLIQQPKKSSLTSSSTTQWEQQKNATETILEPVGHERGAWDGNELSY
jgi:hypothetical protein